MNCIKNGININKEWYKMSILRKLVSFFTGFTLSFLLEKTHTHFGNTNLTYHRTAVMPLPDQTTLSTFYSSLKKLLCLSMHQPEI